MAERASTKHDIQHDELNTTRPNYSAISRIFVSGSIRMSSTGVDSGTGDVTLIVTGTPSTFDLGQAIADGTPNSILQTEYRFPYVSGTTLYTISYDDLYSTIANNVLSNVDLLYTPQPGWTSSSFTWQCISTDAPIYNVSIPANVTGTLGVGNRIWLQQSGANKFFLIHGVSITGSTTYLNLYGGTDFTLVTGSAISSPQYSKIKAPFGFPLNPDQWTVQVTDTTLRTQSLPSGTMWYNNGSISITAPIGVWLGSYEAEIQAQKDTSSNTSASVYCTLATINNGETDKKWTAVQYRVDGATTAQIQVFGSATRSNIIVATIKTIYYLNQKTDQAYMANIFFRGDLATIVIRLRSAYL